MNGIAAKTWSPYLAGVIIGLLQVPAFLIIGSALGASSSYVSVSAYTMRLIDPMITEIGYFEKYMTSMKYVWQTSMVVAIGVGALISSRLSRSQRPPYAPAWRALAGVTLPQRLGMAFLGGYILLFGARWAGGCTSGHGISGIGQLAVGSMVVVLFMFVGGMAVANLMRRL
ncbi:MAG: YeeE/YedE thiosulfate transporter family protein [Spirochaetota bacterium]